MVNGNHEIEEIEERYTLNLHRQWKVRLPDDLLIVRIYTCVHLSLIFRQLSMMMRSMLEWVICYMDEP